MDAAVEALTKGFKGEMMISMDEEDCKSAEEGFKNALVVKLVMSYNLDKPDLISIIRKVWKKSCKADDYMVIASNTLVVQFHNKMDCERVLNGCPWFYMGQAILIERWFPGKSPHEITPRLLRLWVQVYNVPVEFTSERYAKKIVRAAGKVIRMWKNDQDVLGESGQRLMRFRVEIDITKPVVPGVYLERKCGEPLWIIFRYERLPNCCFKCGLMDHETNLCSAVIKQDKLGPWLSAEYLYGV